jgi:hypothetical protein
MPGNEAFLRPDVYPQEEEVGAAPFQPTGTSAAGFVDIATWGPIGQATFVSSLEDFYRQFGSDFTVGHLARAVKNFFLMGGRRCYIVRTSHYTNITDPNSYTAQKATVTISKNDDEILKIDAKYPGTRGNKLSVQIANVDTTSKTFDLIVLDERDYGYVVLERYRGVTCDENDTTNFVEYRVNANPERRWRGSDYIKVTYVYTGSDVPVPDADIYHLSGGTNGDVGITSQDYVGDPAALNGVYAFDRVDEIVNICHPGNTSAAVIKGGLNYVYNHPYTKPPRTNLYVYDLPLGLKPQEALEFVRDDIAMATGYEAVYYPWVKVEDRYDPVAPYVLGHFAQNDLLYGVWQAPAGVDAMLPVTGLAYEPTLGDQELLHPHGINCITKQDYWGIVIWGARTLRVHTHFRYLNIRRFVNLIKKTVYNAGKQFIFEPNAPKTWARIQESAEALLMYFYSLGAFAGKTPEESFYVKCDKSTNPPELVNQGIAVCEIGIAPVRPLEFLVFNVLVYPEGALPGGEALSYLRD